MAQDSYLIRADEASLARWKQAAKDQGRTFAAFVRDSLDIAADGQPEVSVPPPRVSLGRKPAKHPPAVAAEGKSWPTRSSMCMHRLRPEQFCKTCDA